MYILIYLLLFFWTRFLSLGVSTQVDSSNILPVISAILPRLILLLKCLIIELHNYFSPGTLLANCVLDLSFSRS
nr:MAG TPA: hypothetical protein [Caudoviricetes sp.]